MNKLHTEVGEQVDSLLNAIKLTYNKVQMSKLDREFGERVNRLLHAIKLTYNRFQMSKLDTEARKQVGSLMHDIKLTFHRVQMSKLDREVGEQVDSLLNVARGQCCHHTPHCLIKSSQMSHVILKSANPWAHLSISFVCSSFFLRIPHGGHKHFTYTRSG